MKKNILLVLFSLSFLAGCASTPKLPSDTKFSVENIKVNLTQKLQVEGYPQEAEFASIVKEKLNASLKAKDLLAGAGVKNSMSVTFVIDYKRQFAGEDSPMPSKSVMAPVVGYTIVVSENGVEKKRIAKSGLTLNRGFGSNLLSVATLGLGKDAKDELKDVGILADSIADELRALRK